jgi:hypothetical protein
MSWVDDRLARYAGLRARAGASRRGVALSRRLRRSTFFEDVIERMTPDAFLASSSPAGSPALLALWHDARGNWDAAHNLVNDSSEPDAMWVHAYLHRKEGDLSNARYWYRRAGREPPKGTLEDERRDILEGLLGKNAW